MSLFKSLRWKIGSLLELYDPLRPQMKYAKNTLLAKMKAIDIEQTDNSSILKFKRLWMGRINPWLNFYYTIGNKDIAYLYIPDDWFYRYFDGKLNNWRIASAIDDKNLYDLLFPDIQRPKTIARCVDGMYMDSEYRIISKSDFLYLCTNAQKAIIKVANGSSGGHGVSFWEEGEDLFEKVPVNKPYVVQEIIQQHSVLQKLHPSSINTIRIMTLTLGGEVRVVSSILRMGINGSKVDNVSSGGIACGIQEDGRLKSFAFDGLGRRYQKHPQGEDFEGVIIPSYNDCESICKKLAPRVSRYSNLISWDFSVNEEGAPILIEANLYGGELDFHQMCNGPIFKDEASTREMIGMFVN